MAQRGCGRAVALVCFLLAVGCSAAFADSQTALSDSFQFAGDCAGAETQFQRVVGGTTEPSAEFMDGYCGSACLQSVERLLGEVKERPKRLRLRAMRQLCLRVGEEGYCFPRFLAALRLLAAAGDSLAPQTRAAACSPCVRGMFADLLHLDKKEDSPIELLCTDAADFCFARTRSFLAELIGLNPFCDPVGDSDCRAQAIAFAERHSERDECVDRSLARIAGSRLAPLEKGKIEAKLAELRRLSAQVAAPAPLPEAVRRLHEKLVEVQEDLDRALLLFDPRELLELGFFGEAF